MPTRGKRSSLGLGPSDIEITVDRRMDRQERCEQVVWLAGKSEGEEPAEERALGGKQVARELASAQRHSEVTSDADKTN